MPIDCQANGNTWQPTLNIAVTGKLLRGGGKSTQI
jgi:hypothetical protein